jgi:hypothetical protein
MMLKIKTFLGFKQGKEPTTDFSAFFHNASSAEKKKLLKSVVREANKDQRDLVQRYNMTKPVH